MSDFDELVQAVFRDLRDGVPITGYDSSDMHLADSVHNADGSAAYRHVQSSSHLPTSMSSTASSDARFMPDADDNLSWGAIAPESLVRRPDNFGCTPRYLMPTATSDCLAMTNESLPPPIARNKRWIEEDSLSWHTFAKCARLDGMDAVDKSFLSTSPHTGFHGFPRTYNGTKGNALEHNNHSTRTSGYEEYFHAVGSVPVDEQSLAQGLGPTMTSSAASQRHHTQTPMMSAEYEYSSQLFPFPFSAQSSNAAPGTLHQFMSAPDTATGYGHDSFAQPSFIGELFTPGPSQALSWATTQQAPRYPAQYHLDETSFQATRPSSFPSSVMPWPFGAARESAFSSGPTPFLSTGYGVDPPFTSVAEQPSDQDLVVPVQAPQTSATLPRPLPDPVTESSFGVASKGSSSSSSALKPSNAAPQKKGKKKAQTPFLLAEDKCHLCNEGFKRGSELHHHWTTNKHRLREREAENPGVIVTVDDLTPNCFCPSCGKGYTTPYVVKRHLKKCAGQAGSSQDTSQDGEGGR